MGKTILLADAEEQIVTLVRSLLETRGYTVVRDESGRACLDVVQKEPPDMVIVGEQLSDIDGIGFIVKLRKVCRTSKVVFISNQWREADLYQQLTKDYGVNLVVHRPLKPLLFAAQIDSHLNQSKASLATTGQDPEEKTYLALRARFKEVLPGRLTALQEAITAARGAPENKDLTQEARRLAHNLKGTSRSCGFDMVGDASAELERILTQMQEPEADRGEQAWQLVERLVETVKSQAELEIQHAPTKGQIEGLVDDSAMAKVLVVGKEVLSEGDNSLNNGLPVKVIHAMNISEALDKACRTTLDAVLIDMEENTPQSSVMLARELRGMSGYESLPLGFIAEKSQQQDRIETTHAGASLVLPKPLDQEQLRDGIEYLLAVRQGGRPRILIVDDDEDFSQIIAATLGKEGMLVKSVNDPALVQSTLENFVPDLMLLDVMMPGVSGFDVCRMLRTHARWQELPIFFLTAQTELEARLAAFEAGGDDYLPKPVAPIELLTRVKVRLERSRMIRERADKDILSGLLLRRAFVEQLTGLISEAGRHKFTFSLALLDVDKFKQVNDTYGHMAGDRVLAYLGQLLKRRFRVEDIRGRWGGEEFIVALRHEGKETTKGALARVLEELRTIIFEGDHGEKFSVTFTAGLANFPEDGDTLERLVSVADERLYKGKEAGRNRIVSGG
jgi:diguanylate cyclase (GGDEF)-like protein